MTSPMTSFAKTAWLPREKKPTPEWATERREERANRGYIIIFVDKIASHELVHKGEFKLTLLPSVFLGGNLKLSATGNLRRNYRKNNNYES